MDAADRLIVALDVPTQQEALALLDRLDGRARWVKVGLELYLAEGRPVVETLRSRGLHVFLDLKLHDIPNTVAAAVRSAAATGAELLTVHAGGGAAMLSAAAATAPAGMRLLAVTVLTSMDAEGLQQIGVPSQPEQQVLRLGELAAACGINGLVCSPREVPALRQSAAKNSLLVVPGIRGDSAAADDQRRTSSAADAVRAGADLLVVGRPITRANDPAAALEAMLQQIRQA